MGTPASRPVSRIRATKKRSLTTARTGASTPSRASVGLFTVAEPVLVPLGDVGERGEIAHAVEVDDPVQVVGLVLADPREEVLRDEVHRLPLAVQALQAHGRVAGHHAAHVGDREAALPALLHFVRERRDDRIDDHHQGHRGRVRVARVPEHLDDGDLLGRVYLVRRQPGPVVLAHRLHHVVDESLDLRRANGPGVDGRGDLPQHGMPETRDLQNRHDSLNLITTSLRLDPPDLADALGEPARVGLEERGELGALLVDTAGAPFPSATSSAPNPSSTSASATGRYAGPGLRRLPSGNPRLAQKTTSARPTSAAPATRSVVMTAR